MKILIRLDKALSENVSLRDAWLAVKNKVQEKQVNEAMKNEYNDAVDQLVLKSDEILKKYNTEDESRKEFINELSSLKEYLIEKFGR